MMDRSSSLVFLSPVSRSLSNHPKPIHKNSTTSRSGPFRRTDACSRRTTRKRRWTTEGEISFGFLMASIRSSSMAHALSFLFLSFAHLLFRFLFSHPLIGRSSACAARTASCWCVGNRVDFQKKKRGRKKTLAVDRSLSVFLSLSPSSQPQPLSFLSPSSPPSPPPLLQPQRQQQK